MNPKFASFICACLFTISASADAPASFTIVPASNAAVYSVFYKSAESGRVKISIINSRNQVVFTEVLNDVTSFKRPYNFSELEQGEYTIALEDRNGKQVEKVKYFMNKVSSFIRVAQVPEADNKYLMYIASNSAEVVNVKIFNGDVLLHEERVVTSGNYGVVFNLSQVKISPSSTVTFEVTTDSGKTETAMF